MNYLLLTIKTLMGYCLPLLMGIVIVDLLEGKKTLLIKMEKAGLGFMVGYGVQVLYIFFLGLLKVEFTFLSCSLLIWIFLLIGLIRLIKKSRLRQKEKPGKKPAFNWKVAALSVILFSPALECEPLCGNCSSHMPAHNFPRRFHHQRNVAARGQSSTPRYRADNHNTGK